MDAQLLSVQTGVLRASSRSGPRESSGWVSPASLSLSDLSLAAIKLSKVTILAPTHTHPHRRVMAHDQPFCNSFAGLWQGRDHT